MAEQETRKNKHLTLNDRKEIEACLNTGMTFKAIAKRIGKDPTTVSKEVKLHTQAHRNGFTKTDERCSLLTKAPFVCNSCKQRRSAGCPYVRYLYRAEVAQDEYKTVLSESREGIPLNKQQFYETERIVSSAVRSGQHVYHILKANDLPVSSATVYRHINKGYYSISKIDLPRAVKFKPRKSKHPEFVPKGVKVGRDYQSFLEYMQQNEDKRCVEMDTVIGRIGGKVILTLHFTDFDFMTGILLDNKTAAEAGEKFIAFKRSIVQRGFSFGELAPVILTDNGGEFSNVSAFENNEQGEKETHLFFCDPNAPYEKPHVENNHILLRDILPSGTNFDELNQNKLNLIFSHINAVKRKQFNGKSAYDMFAFAFSPELADAMGISYIDPLHVVQSPALWR